MTTDLARYRAALNGSDSEEVLAFQLKAAGIGFERQYHFAAGWPVPVGKKPRKFAADFWICADRLLVEVDGGGYVSGRHTRGAGLEADHERDALAMLHGWKVLRVTPKMVNDGRALDWIERLLAGVDSHRD
jgi:very-short-patch-repair endonuclease